LSFYLLDHHVNRNNGERVPWYTTRAKPVRLIVIHTAENLPDFDGSDSGAEAVAAYGASTTRASWHSTVDSDSTIRMLPDGFTAWHVRGYTSESLGIELATQAAKWPTAPAAWTTRILNRAADVVAQWCLTHDLPPVLLDAADVAAGKKGITGHHVLDPTRRTDPGPEFPWTRFINLVTERLTMAVPAYAKPSVDKALAAGVFSSSTNIEGGVTAYDLAVFLDRAGAFDSAAAGPAGPRGPRGSAGVTSPVDISRLTADITFGYQQ
jgi:hypothetical protein